MLINGILLLIISVFCVYAVVRKDTAVCLCTYPYENMVMVLLFLLGILMRFLYFWEFPAGLNQDEASIGYDAFADLTYGMDRNGYHNPVYSVAWGSGHSSLYIFLLKPCIALFGLNVFSVRLVNVLFGCLALFAFYGICNQIKGKVFASIGLFLLVINPWHIMMSRWGLECNLFPQVFTIALYCLLKGRDSWLFYLLSAFVFGLSLYAYGTAYMFVPVFLLIYGIILLCKKEITKKVFAFSVLIFTIMAVPILIFMVINICNLPPLDLGFISFPRLASGRYHTTVTVLSGHFLHQAGRNLLTFLKLLLTGYDGLIWNAMPHFGVLYGFSLPLVIPGLWRAFLGKGKAFIISFLFASFVLIALSDLNINRANVIFLGLIYLMTEGIYFLMCQFKKLSFITISIYVVAFCMFVASYSTVYQTAVGKAFFKGFGESIIYAKEQEEGTIYLTEEVNGPYVFALFYEQTDPRLFMATVDYAYENASVRPVNSFGRFVTGIPELLQSGEICVASEKEAAGFDDIRYSKKKFDDYYVISRRK